MPVHDWSKVEAGVFHDFHHELISAVKHVLNGGVLPAGYYAMANQVAGHGRPDVIGLEKSPRGRESGRPNGPHGGAAVATAPRVRFHDTATVGSPRTRKRVAIRHVTGDKVVAVVEIVSPANKDGPEAVEVFAVKLAEYLEAGVHLLVLDLIPPGPADPDGIHPCIWRHFKRPTKRNPGFTPPPDKPLTLAAYAAGKPYQAFVEPVGVGDGLPRMPLFLTPKLHVLVPLDTAYAAAWELMPARWREVLDAPA